MNYDVARISRTVATLGTFTVFSGYLAYHFAVANLGMPRFLSGYYSPVVTACAATILYIQLVRPSLTVTREDVSVYSMCAAMALFSLGYLALGDPIQSNARYATISFETLWIFFSTYVLIKNANLRSPILFKFVAITLAAQIILINYMGILIGQFSLATMSKEESLNVAGNKQIATVLLFQLGLIMANVSPLWRAILYVVGTATLFFNGARTEFVCFTISGFVLLARSFSTRSGSSMFALGIAVSVAWLAMYIGLDNSSSRVASLTDIFNQSSYIARSELSDYALRCIERSPLSGCYGEDMLLGEGNYSHNALSAWQTYGFPIFAAYFLTFANKSLQTLAQENTTGGQKDFAIYYGVVAVLCMFFSKHFLDVTIAIALALMSNARVSWRERP